MTLSYQYQKLEDRNYSFKSPEWKIKTSQIIETEGKLSTLQAIKVYKDLSASTLSLVENNKKEEQTK